ncbi:hypothetical protein [Caldimonas sp. KR1-144]|uniref:hypothetical protein n=1 Tax=Caldimonas sp. KR1-144 TaxID=3400911 RepID=UPI003BFF2F6D
MAQKNVVKQDDAWPWSASVSPQAPLARSDAGTAGVRESWFDSSWELRRGLQVEELDELPSAFGGLGEDGGLAR